MPQFLKKEVLAHPLVLSAIGAAVLIAVGSGFYYYSGSQVPATPAADTASTTTAVVGTGTVEPAQNPDLAFVSGGRVAAAPVAVSQTVARGALLASLDTAALAAARGGAKANLEAAQAKLAGMQAGPRAVDVSAKQTAVAQAEQSLANLYQTAPSDLSNAYSNASAAVTADADPLFSNPTTSGASLIFQSSDSQSAADSINGRITAGAELAVWKGEVSGINAASTPQAVNAALAASIQHLAVLRSFLNSLTQALTGAIVTSTFTSASLVTANADLAAMRTALSGSLAVLQGDQNAITTASLAVQSAEDALNQTLAGPTAQDLQIQQAAVDAAQANLNAANAALQNAVVVAPYAGTVSRVAVKVGDIVPPNTVAVSLSPLSALQVDAYLSELDAAKVAAGDNAVVTLDAYGTGRPFNATVISVDRSPTMQNNVPSYQVVLQFAHNDPALSPGMTANVSITPAAH